MSSSTSAALPGNLKGATGIDECPTTPKTTFLQAEQTSGSGQVLNTLVVDAAITVQRANDAQPIATITREIETQSATTTAPYANKSHAAISKRANCKRVFIITSVAVATILVTAAAMKAASYTYDDIKWPITVEIMVFTIFLTPVYANALAQ
ncbi:hypothetical protein GGR51DRAFT_556839 [Nemania sp. FL0031]|nr:hypothetical protein GGR51DRAFT_556839 [Nemania sp. FL0031]